MTRFIETIHRPILRADQVTERMIDNSSDFSAQRLLEHLKAVRDLVHRCQDKKTKSNVIKAGRRAEASP